MKIPSLPWKFERMTAYEENAKILGKTLAPHEGYNRTNDGDWVIIDKDGRQVAMITFRGKAKRGEKWNAPDPEGQAIAQAIVDRMNKL